MSRQNKPVGNDKMQALVAAMNRAKAQFIACARSLETAETQRTDFRTDAAIAALPRQAIEVMRRFNHGELDEEQFFNQMVAAVAAYGNN